MFSIPDVASADNDSDPDGADNGLEFLTVTDPLDPGSVWKPQFEIVDGELCIQIPVTNNRSYVIEASSDLEAWSTWQTDGNPFKVGDEAVASVKVTGSPTGDAFYRIRISGIE